MPTPLNRRNFLTRSALASAGVAAAAQAAETPIRVVPSSKGAMPMGRIGKLTVSRLVSGGNLISGWAHSRDLHYVPSRSPRQLRGVH
jgi:hypothetical protein